MPRNAITFIVPGEEQAAAGTIRGGADAVQPEGTTKGRVKQSVRVANLRAAAREIRVVAVSGKDVVVLRIAGGPSLTLHPENARDLLMAQGAAPKRNRAAAAPDEVHVTPQLQWRGLEQGAATRGATRGFLGDVLLSAVEVVTDLATDAVVGKAADFAASQVVKLVDAQVEPGVYGLRSDTLKPLKGSGLLVDRVPAAPDGGSHLVLLHGTFSETSGTFGKLWSNHPERVRTLFKQYGSRVYALDHPTLGASPIANAVTLARALPAGARLHLLTHSRGGLVAEVFARVAANSKDTFKPFAGKAYAAQREELRELASIVAKKNLRVDRVVRVACPARGTLLASKRLDAYISVFKWTLELAGIPVAPALVDFLGAVAQRNADPEILPGLAAQIPDSPLVRWLHVVEAPIAGDLRVIAGDLEGDSVTSWVKTLLADSFYWTDNDLIVQTRSMYGGAPRAASARFLLHQGGKVSHFNYFKNERTAEAIVNALVQDLPQGFSTIGPLSWAGESATGVRAARRSASTETAAAGKPAVFLLPGILGSNLKAGADRIWLGWRVINGLDRLGYVPGKADGVKPDGPIGTFYDALADFLSTTHEVIEFAFDWRRPIEEEAKRLAAAVNAALEVRERTGQPVRMLAHSMGGLVARTLQLEAPGVWARMMAHAGARLLMLGTPNGGSWAPMQVLSGDDTFGNALAAVGAPFRDDAARGLMARFPGFLQLQAGLLDEKLALGNAKTWQALADDDFKRAQEQSWWHRVGLQLDAMRWGVPSQDTLDRAVRLRRRLDAQRDETLGAFKDKLLLVVGRSRFTPDGFEIGSDGFVYLNAPDTGDGRVPLGCALLPGVRTWVLDCEHGNLPSRRAAFPAYQELLQQGTTNLLDSLSTTATRGGALGAVARSRSRPSRVQTVVRPPETEGDVLAPGTHEPVQTGAARPSALRVTVINGDLTFIRQPLLIGHYRSTRLTGTEWVMNKLVGEAMAVLLDKGVYPDSPGTHRVFLNTRVRPDNPWQVPRPEAVIVVGLGIEGNLSGSDLVHTVRQAVIAWSQRLVEKRADWAPLFELAATLIGSGGPGISAGQSAQLIAQGVREANERLDDDQGSRRAWPRVNHLHLIELYLDRASDAWRALQMQAAASPGRYTVTEVVQAGAGALRRPLDSGYRGADYDFIAAVSDRGPNGEPLISYTLDTKRARTEVRAQAAQGALLRDLVTAGSNDKNTDKQIGRTLFQLLVPLELEPFLSGTTEMQIELDRGTAGIPWELLDVSGSGGQNTPPWAIRTKLLRKLRTGTFREQVADASPDASILVIGEPDCDLNIYPPLPGAREEARAVAARLGGPGALPGAQIRSLINPDESLPGPDARTVISTLMAQPWRIVHIAGHGAPPEMIGPVPTKPGDPEQKPGDPRGVVLSNGVFLGPREIRNMRTVPELVFVNCCHLAVRATGQLLTKEGAVPGLYDRASFASGVAEELINLGVRCVIAAGWAVDDGPALTFATTFYDALLRGLRFIDAVGEARAAAFAQGGNTWAAYQCYGDPDWVFRRAGADAQRPSRPLADEFAGVASARDLCLALETLAVRSRFQGARPDEQGAKIRHLESRFSALWGHSGDVAEAFGMAWQAAGDGVSALQWLERAVAASDGTASGKAAEQFGNLRVRVAWDAVERARGHLDDLRQPVAAGNRRVGKAEARSADIAAAERSLATAVASARQEIDAATAFLAQLTALRPTTERESLLASAYKRLAMIEGIAGRASPETEAITKMYEHYRHAEERAKTEAPSEFFYPALNRMAGELMLHAGRSGWKGFDRRDVAAVGQSLAVLVRDNPDFWSIVGLTELRLYEAVAHQDLERQRASIESEYDDLHARMNAGWMWKSVYDQATFVLPKYAMRAALGERRAAEALLGHLATLARAGRAPIKARDASRDIFISFASADKDFAAQLAREIEKQGLTAVSRKALGHRQRGKTEEAPRASLEEARASVIIVSKATGRAPADLSNEWSAVVQKRWSEPGFRLFYVKRQADAVTPAFLEGASGVELRKSGTGLSTVVRALARSLEAGADGRPA